MLSVGVIGYSGHAGRLIDIVNGHQAAKVSRVFHPTKTIPGYELTNDFHTLLELDCVVIASPNFTHFQYLEQFAHHRYSGYVLCEKPPVVSQRELAALKSLDLDPRRLLFNFNYRSSEISRGLELALRDGSLGRPFEASVMSSHGLAFTKGYQTSWRADKDRHRGGILETKSIHWIDLFIGFFGKPDILFHEERSVSVKGAVPDTSHLTLRFPNEIIVNIVSSYGAPLQTTCTITGTNGILEYKNGTLWMRHPRDSFDEHGRFSYPTAIYKKEFITHDAMCLHSISKNVDFFLSTAQKLGAFPVESFHQSLTTTELFTSIEKTTV